MNKLKLTLTKFRAIKAAGSLIPQGKTLADVPTKCIMTLPEAATILKYTITGLRKHKNRPGMPPYYKMTKDCRGPNGRVFYDKRDLLNWLAKFKVIIP